MEGGLIDRQKGRTSGWKQDPEAVRADILRVATDEFAARGLSGGRIDEIARRTTASKRMIYYYFGDKEGLYRAVLERVYTTLRQGEDDLNVDGLDPVTALRRLTEATFDAHADTPQFIRLVMIENIHNAEHLRKSPTVPVLNRSIIAKLEDVCLKGKETGLFRSDIDALELHWMISSFSFYNISNRATFSTSFGERLFTIDGQAALRRHVTDMVLCSVMKNYVPVP